MARDCKFCGRACSRMATDHREAIRLEDIGACSFCLKSFSQELVETLVALSDAGQIPRQEN